MAPEPPFTDSSAHPRSYGNFARLLGRYVRDEKVLPMAQAIHKLTGLPATNLDLTDRGFLKEGFFADIVVFDPQTIADRATYEKPHQFAVGVLHVFVNGVQVLADGEHTGANLGALCRGQILFFAKTSSWEDIGRREYRRPFNISPSRLERTRY